ncbi:MAG: Gfo/Idh/MocA family oxidoreductase, partial [Candidatus Bathyarchaeia archaeon]
MKVKVGFLGCGGIAHAHMERLAKMDDVEMVAFCDVVKERAEGSAQRYGGRAYTDHHSMLENEELQALFVALPPFAHTDGEIIAAEKGIHLFIEKPIALTLEKAKEIDSAIKKNGVIASVGYHFRYMDTVEEAKQFVEGKTIGMVLGYWIGGFPGVYWWRKMDMSGGQIVEQTTHIFDLAR